LLLYIDYYTYKTKRLLRAEYTRLLPSIEALSINFKGPNTSAIATNYFDTNSYTRIKLVLVNIKTPKTKYSAPTIATIII